MKTFNSLEEEAFESPPVLNSAERKRFFYLPLMLEDPIMNLRTSTNKVCFLVAVGYFKARHMTNAAVELRRLIHKAKNADNTFEYRLSFMKLMVSGH